MASAADVVRQLCAAIDRKDLAEVESLLDENVVYHNIGSEPAVGREANGIVAPVPVMGTFEVKDERIVQWRDYFDMGLTGKLLSGEDVTS